MAEDSAPDNPIICTPSPPSNIAAQACAKSKHIGLTKYLYERRDAVGMTVAAGVYFRGGGIRQYRQTTAADIRFESAHLDKEEQR